jgi:hypothetical protein
MFPGKTFEEKLFDREAINGSCESMEKLPGKKKESFSKYIVKKLSEDNSEDGSRELALDVISWGCLGKYAEASRQGLMRILFEDNYYLAGKAMAALGKLECVPSVEISNRLLELLKSGEKQAIDIAGLLKCAAPSVEKVISESPLDEGQKVKLLFWVQRSTASHVLMPVYPFRGYWIVPITPVIDAIRVGSEWIVLGTDSVVRSKIGVRDNRFHGIGCDHTNQGNPVYKMEMSTLAVGVPIVAYGPISKSESLEFSVEKGRIVDAERGLKIAEKISEQLSSEYGYKSEIKYYVYPGKSPEQHKERVPIGQMVSFSSGVVVFQWEQMNSTGTFRKCVRIVDSADNVSGCKEIDEFFGPGIGGYVFYHIANPAVGLDIYVAITVNEPWDEKTGTMWGPERRVFRFAEDILPWENFDSMLDPRCMEI